MKETKEKKKYFKPEIEIINLKVEQPLLSGSAPDFGDGGYWG